MLFPTIDFAIFFAVAFTVNWLLNPYPGLWKLSMIGLSYVFYGWWDWSFIFLLAATTAIALRRRRRWSTAAARARPRIAMVVSVGALLGLLGWFKYYGFVAVNLDNLTHASGLGRPVPLLQVALPIAISFFTFMAISYVVDIYRGSSSRPGRSTSPSTSRSSPTWSPGPIVAGHRAAAPDPPTARPARRRLRRGVLADHAPGCSRRS